MKKRTLLILGIVFCLNSAVSQEYKEMIDLGTFSVQEVIDNAENYFADKDKGKGSGYVQFKRWEYNAMYLMNEDGYLSSIEENIVELERYNAYLNETSQNRQAGTDNWIELGPDYWNATISVAAGVGRITSISIDKNNSDHIIIGAQTGGVWKTLDGGQNWTPLSDYFANLNVYSVAIDPSNSGTYYFGSIKGLIYKSTDSGATWNFLGDLGISLVNKLLIHPTNSNIMFGTSQNEGIKKSIDGGVNWTTAVTDGRGYDIEFKPGDPNVVYASGNGFHKSIDGGATFTTIGGFEGDAKMIGISPNDPSIVYVIEASNNSFGGFYTSSNSGSSFAKLNHEGRNYFGAGIPGTGDGGQAPRDMDIAVNPNDVNEVHIAGINTWRSFDGGVTFSITSTHRLDLAIENDFGYCHADIDILVFNGSTLFVGTDGGIFKAIDTSDLNFNYYEDITIGLGIRQFYKIGVSQTENVVVSGGSQDNGTSFFTQEGGWKDWMASDGMETFIDKDNSNIMYGMVQFGNINRTEDGGLTSVSVPIPDPGSWVTPFEQDPSITNTVYLGINKVYKSPNKGYGWVAISQDFGANLSQLKIAPSNNQIIYAARSSSLYKTDDGGATNWVEKIALGGFIKSIAIHPTDPNKIAIASTLNKVLVSLDGGDNWIDYTLNLPEFSAFALVWDDNGADALYVGMNYGIFYIDNTFTEWQPYNNNLPNVIIKELEINSVDGKIYAGTYGRGLWASNLANPALSTQDFLSQNDIILYPNPANTTVTINLQKEIEVDIRVFDMLGKLVIYQPDVSITNNHILDISNLNKGIYFIRINSEIGSVTKKLIKD